LNLDDELTVQLRTCAGVKRPAIDLILPQCKVFARVASDCAIDPEDEAIKAQT